MLLTTLNETVQLADVAIDPPVNLKLLAPGSAVKVPEQLVEALGEDAIDKPLGKAPFIVKPDKLTALLVLA